MAWPFAEFPARPQEQLLIDVLADFDPARVLCTSIGRGQLAYEAAARWPGAQVACHYLDLYRATQTRDLWDATQANLTLDCAADFTADPESLDLAALPLTSDGEGELARDLLQAAHVRLKIGGVLLASSDNPRDSWLQAEMQKLVSKVERRQFAEGVVYLATKREPLKKLKDFSTTFAFRDQGRLFTGVSRPGVFAHRRIDPGARKLLDTMRIEPGARVLDLGCGSGVLALAAAGRTEGVTVHAVDSAARAVECTRRGAELNELPNLTVELNADGAFAGLDSYTLALANPPYYANFRIAEHFIRAAHRGLQLGGQLLLVTKFPDWYLENMPEIYDDVTAEQVKDYAVVRGVAG